MVNHSNDLSYHLARRQFIRNVSVCTGAFFVGADCLPILAQTRGQHDPFRGGKLLSEVPFLDEGHPEMNAPIGEELDGRLFTDLSRMTLDQTGTPTPEFYVRTRASKLLPDAKSWTVKIDGLVEHASTASIVDLKTRARPTGLHLMECAGNARFAHFGLISVAKWAGVPLADILTEAKPKSAARLVLISGFDQYATQSASSVPGASWIFPIEELKNAGAFLATQMNEQPLTADHGAPVRLVVPGWYGCTCIKWVDTITLVDDDAEATSQMKEYAARTHQNGVPAMARDYEPAVIDQAAMPIRVEKWLVDGKIKYCLMGILWGGRQIVKVLQIRFNPEEDYVNVDYFNQKANDPWSFWTHAWSPNAPGTYSIRLTVKEPPVRTRRLDSGYYVRTADISEV